MAQQLPPSGYILGLDVGDKRIGVAIASPIAKLPRPLKVLQNDKEIYEELSDLVKNEMIGLIIVGLPRNLEGGETQQTQKVREFARNLERHTSVPVEFADETLSTVRAQEGLSSNRKNQPSEVDSLAACFILDEFFANIEQV
jgi:putative holliday junction resolvase